MTAQESSAITELSKAVYQYMAENRDQHKELKSTIEQIGARVGVVETKCHDRNMEVDAILARRTVAIDAEIAAAKLEATAAAVAEIEKPGVYAQATQGALDGLMRFALKAGVLVGLVAGFLTLLEKFHVF